ncbi:MAG TPA: hypothetical protein VG937_09655 [Polyangiaceae bacterium]|nr:hypothetical protein [Polyangiaceae bacterium]
MPAPCKFCDRRFEVAAAPADICRHRLIAGNVYLFAASEGLAAWFHNCDKAALSKKLNLRPEQHALFAQSVGYREHE